MIIKYGDKNLDIGRFTAQSLIAIEAVAVETERTADEVLNLGLLQNDKASLLLIFYCLITNKSEVRWLKSYADFLDFVKENPISQEDFDAVYTYLLTIRQQDLRIDIEHQKKSLTHHQATLTIATIVTLSAITWAAHTWLLH